MPAKNPIRETYPVEGDKRELEYLYARRSAIDSLIRSLQEYDMSQMRWIALKNQETA